MGEARHGMEKIFRGVMNYRLTHQRNMVDQFKKACVLWRFSYLFKRLSILVRKCGKERKVIYLILILQGVVEIKHHFQCNISFQVRDHPVPTAVFFTCVDSRMLPSRYCPFKVFFLSLKLHFFFFFHFKITKFISSTFFLDSFAFIIPTIHINSFSNEKLI